MIGLAVILAVNNVYTSSVLAPLAVRMKKLARLAAYSVGSADLKMDTIYARQMFKFHISPLLISLSFSFGYFS